MRVSDFLLFILANPTFSGGSPTYPTVLMNMPLILRCLFQAAFNIPPPASGECGDQKTLSDFGDGRRVPGEARRGSLLDIKIEEQQSQGCGGRDRIAQDSLNIALDKLETEAHPRLFQDSCDAPEADQVYPLMMETSCIAIAEDAVHPSTPYGHLRRFVPAHLRPTSSTSLARDESKERANFMN